ncbi:hypothetical protein HMPREF1487_08718 [Pseudomonas sp. HPB0071]|nr:hypothetical protein HMPREF1487_08718 [Pseudomonas sp. HPB0071]
MAGTFVRGLVYEGGIEIALLVQPYRAVILPALLDIGSITIANHSAGNGLRYGGLINMNGIGIANHIVVDTALFGTLLDSDVVVIALSIATYCGPVSINIFS